MIGPQAGKLRGSRVLRRYVVEGRESDYDPIVAGNQTMPCLEGKSTLSKVRCPRELSWKTAPEVGTVVDRCRARAEWLQLGCLLSFQQSDLSSFSPLETPTLQKTHRNRSIIAIGPCSAHACSIDHEADRAGLVQSSAHASKFAFSV
jgi:hypothetical protein